MKRLAEQSGVSAKEWSEIAGLGVRLVQGPRGEAPSEDASMCVVFRQPSARQPGWARFVALDGVTTVDDSITGLHTPTFDTPEGVVNGARMANRITFKHLSRAQSPADAIAAAHAEIRGKWGTRNGVGALTPAGTSRDRAPREMPMTVAAVVDVFTHMDGRRSIQAHRWGDGLLWTKSAGLWTCHFDEQIHTSAALGQWREWRSTHTPEHVYRQQRVKQAKIHRLRTGDPMPEITDPSDEDLRNDRARFLAERQRAENHIFTEKEWLLPTVGRFEAQPNGESIDVDTENLEALVLATDGWRLDNEVIEDVASGAMMHPGEHPNRIKAVDDYTGWVIDFTGRYLESTNRNPQFLERTSHLQ